VDECVNDGAKSTSNEFCISLRRVMSVSAEASCHRVHQTDSTLPSSRRTLMSIVACEQRNSCMSCDVAH